jgi:hypothetical protein
MDPLMWTKVGLLVAHALVLAAEVALLILAK